MPYVRLYSRHLTLEQKRVIAQKLIEITLRSFHLRRDERYHTSIQFITLPRRRAVDGLESAISRENDFTLEVLGHNLTEEKKKAFAGEVSAILTDLVSPRPWGRIARVFGIQADRSQPVALQFHELCPAISDPFVVYSEPLAA